MSTHVVMSIDYAASECDRLQAALDEARATVDRLAIEHAQAVTALAEAIRSRPWSSQVLAEVAIPKSETVL